MRTSKFSEEQIIGFLRQAEASMPIKEIGRKTWARYLFLLPTIKAGSEPSIPVDRDLCGKCVQLKTRRISG